ncbi:hypothetical protein MCOR25_010692 [Pyricularia grisea]|nr:hypothetical protein MCOR25_010692 [Pyricularia grisea]
MGQDFGGKKYLWGNTPAFDVLNLESNEGVDYNEQLNLLFAASGDLRNVVKTIAQIPASYCHTVNVTLNDLDFDIVARNAIMLFIAFVVDQIDDAVDCIIHIWYSAFIRKHHLEILQKKIRPLIQDVCKKIEQKKPGSIQGKTWRFGQHSLKFVLEQSAWSRLLSYLDVPFGLDNKGAQRIRRAVTLAESRKDYRHRNLLFHTQSHRIAKHRFWEDGILLPFGLMREEFVEPNPTLFQTDDTWPLRDNADPFNGWLWRDIHATPSGPATADIYGKLFCHVQNVLASFLRRLSSLTAVFQLLQVNARDLEGYIGAGKSFNRIKVANISDCGYLGPHLTVGIMAPMLQEPAVNPHATLITLFINAVNENMTEQDRMETAISNHLSKILVEYLPPIKPPIGKYDPGLIKFVSARDLVIGYEQYFGRFKEKFKLRELVEFVGAEMKDRHTIIEKWPYRMKFKPKQPGAQQKFELTLANGLLTKERYMEWGRA